MRTKGELVFYIYEDWKACLDKLMVHHSYCLKSLVLNIAKSNPVIPEIPSAKRRKKRRKRKEKGENL